MNYSIDAIEKKEYPFVVDLWEASVRATHHFLKEEDILYFKPLILNTYLDAVKLSCIRDGDGNILGFQGVAEENLEMLFIHPDQRRKGIGKALLEHAVKKLGITKVDVNEQNEQALGFYQHHGFEVISRSELDSSGKAYPILHMELKA
ncbi:MAG: GNAT family N-acetyltransferase [Bacteroidota bacterium]